MSKAVEITNVTKTFGNITAVDDLSLNVPEGKIYGFIGPNGSGKTTTLRMIMNIYYPDRGIIRVFDKRQSESVNGMIGYLPEERGLYRKMRVYDHIRFYAELQNGCDIRNKINFWLEKFELAAWANKKVEALSKGMSQKLQFILAVVNKPRLLILDEPFSGLDPVNADVLMASVLELQASGTTVIFSTHDMNVAEKICDYIFMIYKGRKVLDGTLSAIQDEYGSDTIRIQTEAGVSVVHDLNGVDKINDLGQSQELRVSPETNPQDILSTIMSRTKVRRFEITKPSLHDIFVRIAGPEATEVPHV